MKQVLTAAFALLMYAGVSAQSEKFTVAIKKNLAAADTSFGNPDALLNVSKSFERIAVAEKNQWLPFYYAAYLGVYYGYIINRPTENDALADNLEVLLQKADSLNPKSSEISTVKSMIAGLRMMVNPQARFMEYSAIVEKELKNASTQDPTNPRPYLIRGQNLRYTPEAFGGGCAAAKPVLETAMQKFADFKPASDIDPTWGKAFVERLLTECK